MKNTVSPLKTIFAILLVVTICVFSCIVMFYKPGKQFTPERTPRQQQLEDEMNQQIMMSLIILST